MTYYVGQVSAIDLLGESNPRFFYSLRRTNEGTLYFEKIDQIVGTEAITINVEGPASEDYEDFEYGVDFFDGRLAEDHSRPFANLKFDQYRWDQRNCYYYINSKGQLVIRVNQAYVYDESQIVPIPDPIP
jgi:hypothetical protein